MEAKLKIDLIQGILEVEGNENFVTKVYEDFKQQLASKPSASSARSITPKPEHDESRIGDKHADRPKAKRKAASARKTPSLVKDLDLSGGGKSESLKAFVGNYDPKTAMDWNTLFVYYLQKRIEVPAIGIDHVYTCYKHVNAKPPRQLYQSLADTAKKKAYIDTKSFEAITVTIHGENYVEYDMPKKEQSAEGTSK